MIEDTASSRDLPKVPNAGNFYEVSRADLPLHCPLPGASLWNSHPRVYLPIEAGREAKCGYCGAVYRLVESDGTGD